jgi:hypothetical protein
MDRTPLKSVFACEHPISFQQNRLGDPDWFRGKQCPRGGGLPGIVPGKQAD